MDLSSIESNIIRVLLKNPDMTIKQIADSLHIHRTTASKYLAVLEASGLLEHRDIGKAKLYSIKFGMRHDLARKLNERNEENNLNHFTDSTGDKNE